MTGETALALTAENSCPPPVAPSKAPVPPVTWKAVSMRRPCMAQSSWCEWVKIVPLSKMNAPGSSTMLQVPPGEKSTVMVAWKEPLPVDRLLLASATMVDRTTEHEGSEGSTHVTDVN